MVLLSEEEKWLVIEVLMDVGVVFIVINIGWYGGVIVVDVKLFKKIIKVNVGIKVVGGIKIYK